MRIGPVHKENLRGLTKGVNHFVKAWLFLALPMIFSYQLLSATGPSPASTSPQRIHRLIEALGNADYFVRQKAESDLGKIGFDAIEALTAAAEHDDMEIATRANRLLCTIRSNWSVPGEPVDVAQLLAGYDLQDDASREAKILRLIDLPQNRGVPAVCRVIRYERSLSLAKIAALRLLKSMAGPDLPATLDDNRAWDLPGARQGMVKPELAAAVQEGLASCRRAGSVGRGLAAGQA